MRKIRSDISLILCLVLSAGLIISAVHSHDLYGFQKTHANNTGQQIFQTYDTCPVCCVVFKGELVPENSASFLGTSSELLPYSPDRVVFRITYLAKEGRSPPLYS